MFDKNRKRKGFFFPEKSMKSLDGNPYSVCLSEWKLRFQETRVHYLLNPRVLGCPFSMYSDGWNDDGEITLCMGNNHTLHNRRVNYLSSKQEKLTLLQHTFNICTLFDLGLWYRFLPRKI